MYKKYVTWSPKILHSNISRTTLSMGYRPHFETPWIRLFSLDRRLVKSRQNMFFFYKSGLRTLKIKLKYGTVPVKTGRLVTRHMELVEQVNRNWCYTLHFLQKRICYLMVSDLRFGILIVGIFLRGLACRLEFWLSRWLVKGALCLKGAAEKL